MATPTDIKNLDGYGNPPLAWSRIQARLAEQITQAPGDGGPNRHTCWLATTRPDGAPHVTAVGMLLLDGDPHFTSSPRARKAQNLARNPACTITVAVEPFDLAFEGRAVKVTDADALARVAAGYNAFGWPATVQGAALTAPFNAPSAGPPPYEVYRLTPATVVAVATAEPFGVTRFRF